MVSWSSAFGFTAASSSVAYLCQSESGSQVAHVLITGAADHVGLSKKIIKIDISDILRDSNKTQSNKTVTFHLIINEYLACSFPHAHAKTHGLFTLF